MNFLSKKISKKLLIISSVVITAGMAITISSVVEPPHSQEALSIYDYYSYVERKQLQYE